MIRNPNRIVMTEGSRIAASSTPRRTGKPSAHGMRATAAGMGKRQNMATYSHWPPSGCKNINDRMGSGEYRKSERRIGQHEHAGAAELPWLENCGVNSTGSTSNAAGSCRSEERRVGKECR